MNAQILDVDCVQVGADDPQWASRFRANAVLYEEDAHAMEISSREPKAGFTYLVRLWCRTDQGEALCVVVANAFSTSYRLLAPHHAHAHLASATLAELTRIGAADVSVVQRRTTAGFRPSADPARPMLLPWLRVRVASALSRNMVSKCVERAARMLQCVGAVTPHTGESRVDVHAELLEQQRLRPGGWVELLPESWARARKPQRHIRAAWVLQVSAAELHPSSEQYDSRMAPLRVLSWDLECYSASRAFPQGVNPGDAIISIGMHSKTFFANAAERRVVLCLGSISADTSASDLSLQSFPTEAELLRGFSREIEAADADFLVGYNICGFDWKYLLERVAYLKSAGELDAAAAEIIFRTSRVRGAACAPKAQDIHSSAMGENPLCFPRTPGRVGLDLLFWLKRQNSPDLPNLKLNTVAEKYLGDTKVDLPAKQMFAAYESGPEGRRQVAIYCAQDCKLVLDLVEKLGVFSDLFEMAKVTYTIPEDLLHRGQQIKVYTQLLRAAHDPPIYIVQDPPRNEEEHVKFQGAHVEDPQVGYYADPIITVDFASLYPSLIRTYNLSPDTLLAPADCALVPHYSINVGHSTHSFAKPAAVCGLFPRILNELLRERKRVKTLMAAETDPMRQKALDGRQLALKISANSVYGVCGASRGLLQCREVAEATTAAGRDIIGFTKLTIEKTFRVPGCEVVYGDTDSAFVRLPESHRGLLPKEIFDVGEEMARLVTTAFCLSLPLDMQPYCVVDLEMEKYISPLILYKKKRYVGIAYESVAKAGKLLVKDPPPLIKYFWICLLCAFIYSPLFSGHRAGAPGRRPPGQEGAGGSGALPAGGQGAVCRGRSRQRGRQGAAGYPVWRALRSHHHVEEPEELLQVPGQYGARQGR
jgi:DNA polymerase elongation subunit (family B)